MLEIASAFLVCVGWKAKGITAVCRENVVTYWLHLQSVKKMAARKSCNPLILWLLDQGSNLGPAD